MVSRVEYSLLPFLAICQILKKWCHLKFLLTHGHMPLKALKRYFYGSHPISAKLYEDIWLPWWNTRLLLFLTLGQVLKNLRHFCNFNMGVNGKILKCVISWKRLIVERNGWKFLWSDYLSTGWSHSVHFAKLKLKKKKIALYFIIIWSR